MTTKIRKDWTLYIPYFSTDWPGSRRDDGSIVTVSDFHRTAPMRQVFMYARQEFHRTCFNHHDLDKASIAHALWVCRRVYASRGSKQKLSEEEKMSIIWMLAKESPLESARGGE